MKCECCKQSIMQSPSMPIIVVIRDPENIGPDEIEACFCSWECGAMWFNAQAGEILMADLDSEYWQEQIRS